MPSEDSFLAGKVGAHMTKGIQGDGLSDKYVLLLGALKHVTAYSLESWHDDSGGPRNGTKYNRMGFSFNITRHDLAETYLEQYRIAITESNALGMMCSCECTTRWLALCLLNHPVFVAHLLLLLFFWSPCKDAAVNGTASCENGKLLQTWARGSVGFEGNVVSG